MLTLILEYKQCVGVKQKLLHGQHHISQSGQGHEHSRPSRYKRSAFDSFKLKDNEFRGTQGVQGKKELKTDRVVTFSTMVEEGEDDVLHTDRH